MFNASRYLFVVAILLSFQLASADVVVSRSSASHAQIVSTWIVSDQPVTLWSDKSISSSTAVGRQNSQLQTATRPTSEFVLADVPPARLEVTRILLGELHARQAGDGIIVDLPGDVLFDFDKDILRPDAGKVLQRVAELLRSFPNKAVSIAGHTDSKGDDAYNDALSERRARRVEEDLSRRDETPRHFLVQGFGERQPVAPNEKVDGTDDPEGRQKNRRVEIQIGGK